MDNHQQKELEEKLSYYKDKVFFLEEVIRKSRKQKVKMAQIIRKLLREIN